MAIAEEHSYEIAGMAKGADEQAEREMTLKVADRYRKEFIDLREQRIDPELFRAIPADLMFRYNFVPLEVQNNLLSIAVADPSHVLLSDELSLLLGKKLLIKVATARQISDLLKRTEQSQRVLEQATEAFTLQIGKDETESEETISGDRLTRDSTASPVVRLVETVIFTALERRASDIHIEARDSEVAVKYRIDGVLQHAMQPIAKEWHSTVLSRIKVLSDLDIAERRVPQDGRFREVQGTLHRLACFDYAGEPRRRCRASRARQRDAVGEIPEFEPGRSRFRRRRNEEVPAVHSRALRNDVGYRSDGFG